MSQLSKSLENRIEELKELIDSHQTELAAYERVLNMEISKEAGHQDARSTGKEGESLPSPQKNGNARNSHDMSGEPAFTGTKTSLVEEIVRSRRDLGTTPKEVDAYFKQKKVARSKNLIYNTLSYLVAHGKLERRDGKYFAVAGGIVKTTGAVKKSVAKSVAKKEIGAKPRQLSAEGRKRIQEALRKRWAAKKKADQPALKTASASTKATAKKS